MISEVASAPDLMAPREYCQLAKRPVAGHGYSRLPQELLQAEQALNGADKSAVAGANRMLCRTLLEDFNPDSSAWIMPAAFGALYEIQLARIEGNLHGKDDGYFSLAHDPFLKDLAILRHRLIPFGAELATPYSGVSRGLVLRGGWRQAQTFTRIIMDCGGVEPFLELHMHPDCTSAFTPSGWLQTYENLADFLLVNPALCGVQSTSWFLDPALEHLSPHLAYLREIPQRCGAAILYAGEDEVEHSGAFATSANRRAMYAAGRYRPRLFTRIWPRQKLLQRNWR